MTELNYYKIAPTHLYDSEGKSKLFMTQDEVDKAWGEGWFGPPWLLKNNPLISNKEWATKDDLRNAVAEDPRYKALEFAKKDTAEEIMNKVVEFEISNGLGA